MTPPNLYKYLDINGARLTLQNRTFKYAKPKDFNDIEDMTIRGLFPERIEQAALDIKHNFVDCLMRNINATPTCQSPTKEGILLLQNTLRTSSDISQLKKAMQDEPSFIDINWFTDYCSRFVTTINDILQSHRVLCVSELNDSTKMWERYAQNHQGIILKIFPDLEIDSKFKLLNKVQYCTARPTLYDNAVNFLEKSMFGNPEEITKDKIRDVIHTKTLEWQYESEYRIAIPHFQEESDWNTLSYHPTEISELYLGAEMSNSLKIEMIGLAREINSSIKIFNTIIEDDRLSFVNYL